MNKLVMLKKWNCLRSARMIWDSILIGEIYFLNSFPEFASPAVAAYPLRLSSTFIYPSAFFQS